MADPTKSLQRAKARLNANLARAKQKPGTFEDDTFAINDVVLRIPANAISVEKRSFNYEWETLRSVQSQKSKSGYSECSITVNTIFNFSKFVDQRDLMNLVAGLRATPFCVVKNEHLSRVLGSPDNTGPVAQGDNKFSGLQPLMLALNGITISTLGHAGMPDCVQASLHFTWFNYLPYTSVIAFKTGPDLGVPGSIFESEIWKKFYAPFTVGASLVAWPHKEEDIKSRTTKFTWREFLLVPMGSEAVLEASNNLVAYLKNKPKQALLSLSRSLLDAGGRDKVRPELAENIYSSWYKSLVKEGSIKSADVGDGKALNKVLNNTLGPLIRKISSRNGVIAATDYTDLNAISSILASRLRSLRSVKERTDTSDFVELEKMSAKYQGDAAGGFQLFGRKRTYAILNKNVQDFHSGSPATLERITISFENKLATIPMVGYRYSTLQHTGSIDARLSIVVNTRNINKSGESGVGALNEMYDSIETQALRYKQVPQGLTNLHIENDLLNLFGLKEWMTDTISSDTIPDMPSRSQVVMNFIQPSVTSDARLTNPEEIKQEFVAGSLDLYQAVYKTINQHLQVVKGESGESRTKVDYHEVKTVKTSRDVKNMAFARTVDDSRDAYNEFLKKVHGQIFAGFRRNFGDVSYYKALMALPETGPLGHIPGIDRIKKSVLERALQNSSKESLENQKNKVRNLDTISKEIKTLTKLRDNAPNAGGRYLYQTKLDALIETKRNTIQTLQKMGVYDYIRKTTKIATEVLRNKITLPQFKHLEGKVKADGIGRGLSAYQDFSRQLSSVAGWLEKKNAVSNDTIMKYDPDCYFWYPTYDSGGTTGGGLIDESYIAEAKRQSLEAFRNAQSSVSTFFKDDYLPALNNPENPRPWKQMTQDNKVSDITAALYTGEPMANSLKAENQGAGIKKDIVPDSQSVMPTNWYGTDPPMMTTESIYTATTNLEELWSGVAQGVNPNAPGSPEPKTKGDYSPPADSSSGTASSDMFDWPIKPPPGPMSHGRGFYGRRRGGTVQHRGIDVPKPNKTPKSKWGPGDGIYGTPVYAAADGTVTFVTQLPRRKKDRSGKLVPRDYAGTWIQLRHKDGWITRYMHLKPNSILFKKGDRVRKGKMIARIGRTDNRSTWTHLHFDMQHGPKNFVDPMVVIKQPLSKGGHRRYVPRKPLSPAAQKSVDTGITFGSDSPMGKAIKDFEKSLVGGQAQRMVRAYPTFKLYFIEDDSGERKRLAFDDFFSYSAVQSIRVVESDEIAADLCEIFLTNVSGLLSNRKFRQRSEKQANNPLTAKGKVVKETDSPGLAGTTKENPIASLLLQEGMQIHLRLGYSSDPDQLSKVFTGKIVSVQFTENDDVVKVIAQSYGTELVQAIKGLQKPIESSTSGVFGWNFGGFRDNATTGRILENMMAEPEVLHFGRWKSNYDPKNQDRDLLTQRWTFVPQPQDDNIFAPSSTSDLNTLGDGLIFNKLSYSIYRTTIWDIFQEMTLRHPNFVARPVLYTDTNGERMTMFFGLPNQLYFARSPMGTEQLKQEYLKDVQKQVLGKTADATVKEVEKQTVAGSLLGVLNKLGKATVGVDNIASAYLAHRIEKGDGAGGSAIKNAVSAPYKKARLEAAVKAGWIAPYRRYHLITSAQHIIANNIQANSKDVANTITIKYGGLKKGEKVSGPLGTTLPDSVPQEEELTLKLDAALPTDEIRSQVGQFVNVTNDVLAKRYALGLLLRNVRNIYKGSLVILGNPDIRPHDVVYMLDEYTDMVGAFEVREVQHSFTQKTGFITEIKPAMFAQASEWSLMHSALAMGIVMEGALKGVFKNTSSGKSFSPFPYMVGAGVASFGGFLSQKLINYTQFGHPIIMSPLMYHGRPFAGGVPTRKINKSMWSVEFGKWSASSKVGFDNWLSDKYDGILGWVDKWTGGQTQGDFWRNS